MTYIPKPIDTKDIKVNKDIEDMTKLIAKNAHELWSLQRINDGWVYGLKRDDIKKEHPCLVPYEELPDSEKLYDQNAVMETIRLMLSLGYRISKD